MQWRAISVLCMFAGEVAGRCSFMTFVGKQSFDILSVHSLSESASVRWLIDASGQA